MLNDSVHVVVLDVNGPWDRGVVLAADQEYRSHLPIIKRSFSSNSYLMLTVHRLQTITITSTNKPGI